MKSIIPVERIEKNILMIRGEKVMLDSDLAELYGVEVKVLKQAVRRNKSRFPNDFILELDWNEVKALRSQIVTLQGKGSNTKYLPYPFTEQGVAMLSGVLKSERAVKVNIEIMRTFVKLRQMLSSNAQLSRKLTALEKKYDSQFKMVFDAIRELMTPPEPKKRKIGFNKGKKKKK